MKQVKKTVKTAGLFFLAFLCLWCIYRVARGTTLYTWDRYWYKLRDIVSLVNKTDIPDMWDFECFYIKPGQRGTEPFLYIQYEEQLNKNLFFETDDGSIAYIFKRSRIEFIAVTVNENGEYVINFITDYDSDSGIYYSPDDVPLYWENAVSSTEIVSESPGGYTTGRLCENWFYFEKEY